MTDQPMVRDVSLIEDPWRTQGEYQQDRFRMKLMVIASIVSSLAAIASAGAAVAAVYASRCS